MKRPFLLALALALPASALFAAPATPAKKPAAKPAAKPKPKPKPTTKPAPRPTARPVARPTEVPRPAATATPAPEPVETGPKTWAMFVGVSQYENGISGLRFPSQDATSLRDAMVDPKIGALPKKQTLLLTDGEATKDKIMDGVTGFLRSNVKEGDKVVVFLAGHGIAKGAGLDAKGYFLPTDVSGTTTSALESSAVPLRQLADDLGTLPASQFVIFVDACREDPTPGRGVKGNAMSDILSRGITVVPKDEKAESATFFACSIGQRAFEDAEYGHGVFTNWILQGLKDGAIAQKPDGAVDMGRLSSYVEQKVGDWAKDTTAQGNFEVAQTPELVATQVNNPLVLIKVKGQLSDNPFTPSPPRLFVAASPDNAQVSINGARTGVGTVESKLPNEGEYTVTVSAPGYAPVSRSVKALGGYEHQLTVQLQPTGAGGTVAAPTDAAMDAYKRALEAEQREQWEIAEQGYKAAIAASPQFSAAYEALAELHHRQNRNLDVIADSLGLLANTPKSAHALSMVSRAYSDYATLGAGTDNSTTTLKAVSGYDLPKKAGDLVKLAQRAAKEALATDPNSPEAFLAQGYALSTSDTKGKNKRAALDAWGKAAFLEPTNPANQLGLGYGIRYYANQNKKDSDKKSEMMRAIAALNEAVRLRPTYYEAHRELAFCYLALNDTASALKECKLARSNRGAAGDVNEIAAIEVAMAGLHKQVAESSTGDKKTQNEEASDGYLADAKETAPNADLKVAMAILGNIGISTSFASYLPAELQPLLDIQGAIKDKINGALPDIPGLGRIGF